MKDVLPKTIITLQTYEVGVKETELEVFRQIENPISGFIKVTELQGPYYNGEAKSVFINISQIQKIEKI